MAETIAKALGANEELSGFFAGNDYAVTWTNGNLVEALTNANFVLPDTANIDRSHLYGEAFIFSPRKHHGSGKKRKSTMDAEQLNLIKVLWKNSDVIVNAMTPDFCGELMFLNIFHYIGHPVNIRRAWLPRLVNAAIIKGVSKGVLYPYKYERWLSTMLEQYIEGFYSVSPTAGDTDRVDYPIPESPVAGDTYMVDEEIEIQVVSEEPLFNMPTLMLAAERQLGFSEEKTGELAYSLYLKKLISYPFVIQNTVPRSVMFTMVRNLKILQFHPTLGHLAEALSVVSHRNNFNKGETVYNGHGIVTTGLHPTDLTRDEERLYNLIVERVIQAFTPSPEECARLKKKMAKSAGKRSEDMSKSTEKS